jgi:hypothetical protein
MIINSLQKHKILFSRLHLLPWFVLIDVSQEIEFKS